MVVEFSALNVAINGVVGEEEVNRPMPKKATSKITKMAVIGSEAINPGMEKCPSDALDEGAASAVVGNVGGGGGRDK